jgi:hypothetical protein
MSENFIRWFCPVCNDFVSVRKSKELHDKVLEAKRLPYPIIIKHGNPPHYTIVQLDRDLRDRGRLTSTDFFDLTTEINSPTDIVVSEKHMKENLKVISEELSNIQRKIWDLLEV